MNINYAKQLPVRGEYDVIVCGGGSAGFVAAVQAGRLGLKVALIEKYGALGGVITTGGNNEIALFYAEGKQIISGIGWEFVNCLAAENWAEIPVFKAGIQACFLGVHVNVPMAAYMMDKMCKEANVDVYLLQQVIDVIVSEIDKQKSIDGIVLASKNGPECLISKRVIDCTGDGDVCAMAGAKYELGDPITKELQPGTLRFYPMGYDIHDINEKQVKEAFDKGIEEKELIREDFWAGSPYVIFGHNGNNINHIKMNSVDDSSRAQAEVEGRESLMRITKWAQKNVKGAENFTMNASGHEVAARESRRIIGEKYITVEDFLSAKRYEDAVSYTYYPVDLHKLGDKTLENIFLENDMVPTIPLGALVPKGFANTMMAGRCISGDRLSNSAYRVKASCMAMGQAAAVACAVSLKESVAIKDVDINSVRKVLEENGAIVPR
jgi:ribulose 1,5-bisphosphate synthetase/thiazole synthase